MEDALSRAVTSTGGDESSVMGRRGWLVRWADPEDEAEFLEARMTARMARTTTVKMTMMR